MKNIILISLITIICNTLNAQIITDRPDQTESSSTIAKGNLQIESGLAFIYNDDSLSSISTFVGPTTLFRYGLTDNFEIRVFNQMEGFKNNTDTKRTYGLSDLEAGFKLQLLRKEEVNTEIAFLSHIIIPSGSLLFSNIEYGIINKLSISHETNENVSIGYNIGYNNYGKGDGDLTYSLALGVAINDKASFYLETYGDLIEFEDHLSSFDAGITYLVKDNFQLDFSFGTGINYYMNYVAAGFSWEIKGK